MTWLYIKRLKQILRTEEKELHDDRKQKLRYYIYPKGNNEKRPHVVYSCLSQML